MAEQDRPLSGKVAFIAGASRGIGRDMAIALARAGASIVVASRSETVTDTSACLGPFTPLPKKLSRKAPVRSRVKLDVTKDEEIESAIAKTLETFGRLDILINNAAIQIPGNVARSSR